MSPSDQQRRFTLMLLRITTQMGILDAFVRSISNSFMPNSCYPVDPCVIASNIGSKGQSVSLEALGAQTTRYADQEITVQP